eukprot:PhF_6_TR6887/c0_g1_i1/m.9959
MSKTLFVPFHITRLNAADRLRNHIDLVGITSSSQYILRDIHAVYVPFLGINVNVRGTATAASPPTSKQIIHKEYSVTSEYTIGKRPSLCFTCVAHNHPHFGSRLPADILTKFYAHSPSFAGEAIAKGIAITKTLTDANTAKRFQYADEILPIHLPTARAFRDSIRSRTKEMIFKGVEASAKNSYEFIAEPPVVSFMDDFQVSCGLPTIVWVPIYHARGEFLGGKPVHIVICGLTGETHGTPIFDPDSYVTRLAVCVGGAVMAVTYLSWGYMLPLCGVLSVGAAMLVQKVTYQPLLAWCNRKSASDETSAEKKSKHPADGADPKSTTLPYPSKLGYFDQVLMDPKIMHACTALRVDMNDVGGLPGRYRAEALRAIGTGSSAVGAVAAYSSAQYVLQAHAMQMAGGSSGGDNSGDGDWGDGSGDGGGDGGD